MTWKMLKLPWLLPDDDAIETVALIMSIGSNLSGFINSWQIYRTHRMGGYTWTWIVLQYLFTAWGAIYALSLQSLPNLISNAIYLVYCIVTTYQYILYRPQDKYNTLIETV